MSTAEVMEYVKNPNKVYVMQLGIEKEVPVRVWVKTGEQTMEWMTNIKLRNLRALGLII